MRGPYSRAGAPWSVDELCRVQDAAAAGRDNAQIGALTNRRASEIDIALWNMAGRASARAVVAKMEAVS